MLLLLASIAAAGVAAPPPASIGARAQARAMIRIVNAAPLRFAEIEARDPKALRDTRTRAADGSATPVRVVEFH